MNSNIHSETEFLPTDYATWIAPTRVLGSITAVFSDASIQAMDDDVMASLKSISSNAF